MAPRRFLASNLSGKPSRGLRSARCNIELEVSVFEFHISRQARERYYFCDALFSLSGNVVFADLAATREFAHRMNLRRDAERHPELAVHPGALNAMGLIDEALHVIIAQYRRERD